MDWIVGTSIAVSLLIVFVLLARRPFARIFGAKAAYALWVLPFLRLVMPEVTVPRFVSEFFSDFFAPIFKKPFPETTLLNDTVIMPEIMPLMQQAGPSVISSVEPYLMLSVCVIWAVGAVVFFLYYWTAQTSLMDRLTYKSEPASKLRREITTAAQKAKLKHIPAVRISDKNAGPLVTGLLRPVVILPNSFSTGFSPAQRQYAMIHEFMHVKRGDMWAALAWLAFRAVNWPNPLVHHAARHFRSDQEAACDASVLSVMGDKDDAVSAYAETLIHAAKTAMKPQTENGRASPKASALALTIHHPLKERLMILGNHRKTSNWRSRTAAAVMIIGAATLSAPLIQADAHPEAESAVEELAGKYERTWTFEKDGETAFERFEFTLDGDEVQAFKLDPSGNKIRIDVKDKKGLESLIALKSLQRLEGMEGLQALSGLEGLKGLEGLEGLKALEGALEKLDGSKTFTIFSDGGDKVKLNMHRAESNLAAARALLEDTVVEAGDSEQRANAKRELEKARIALRVAERALLDAE